MPHGCALGIHRGSGQDWRMGSDNREGTKEHESGTARETMKRLLMLYCRADTLLAAPPSPASR